MQSPCHSPGPAITFKNSFFQRFFTGYDGFPAVSAVRFGDIRSPDCMAVMHRRRLRPSRIERATDRFWAWLRKGGGQNPSFDNSRAALSAYPENPSRT